MLAGSRGGHRGGSGTVHFPPGDYLCYSSHLKSNVSLYLEQGARIIGADSPAVGDTNTNAYDQAEPTSGTNFRISATATGTTASSGATACRASARPANHCAITVWAG